MEQLKLINPENASEEEAKSYTVREAARAVVLDNENNIAILHVSKYGFYKLPGGGLEAGEGPLDAAKRECMEEVGCDIEVTNEIGIITEYRKMFELKQISYCYLAKVKGEKGEPKFDQAEIDEGSEIVWMPYDKALEALKANTTHNKEGKIYIVVRDIIFLEEARKYLGF